MPEAVRVGEPRRIKILYILGSSRCGSTILEGILGEVADFFSVGELRFLWQRLLERRLCGCGKSLAQCEVWSRVLDDDLAALRDPGSLHRAMRWQRDSVRLLHLLRLLLQTPSGLARWTAFRETAGLSASLYRRIAEVTGARVIIDSSKRASNASVFRLLSEFDVYFVHLVRDPRAVAYSQQRPKKSPDSQTGEMPLLGTVESTFQWLVMNGGAAALRRLHHGRHSLLVRYEDFTAAPQVITRSILDFIRETDAQLPFVDERTVEVGVHHTVAGNPVRFSRGATVIQEDDQWKSRLPKADRLVSTAMAIPQMIVYRYPLRVNTRTHTRPVSAP
jgi:hypothetical protein